MFEFMDQHNRDCPGGSLFGLNRFGVGPQEASQLLAEALRSGGSYADLYFEYSASEELVMRDGKVDTTMYDVDCGMGVRVLDGDRTGYAYTETVTMPEMRKAARTAAAIASTGPSVTVIPPFKAVKGGDVHPFTASDGRMKAVEQAPLMLELNEAARSADSRVCKVTARLSHTFSDILFANSCGNTFHDIRPMTSLSVSVVMARGSHIETASAGRSLRRGLSMIDSALAHTLASEAVSKCAVLFEAVRPKGGRMSVVMGAGGSGILLHEAIGHAFEADFNRKNTSIFADRMGKMICSPEISVVDDGTIPFNRGSVNFDDEGTAGQKTYMVRDGRLESYLHDRISAAFYGVQPTGNGRRESFRFSPLPRMRATYMEGGKASAEDIIAQVSSGIYVDTFSNGQVQIGAGDFTFYVKNGRIIENGRLTRPVKDINIIGNGPGALAAITAVGNDPLIDDGTWTCGKGQYCPVSCGMPTVLVEGLTVGGI